jgi:hypothetical protein
VSIPRRLPLLLILLLVGCDAVVIIEGEIASTRGDELERCTATLYRADVPRAVKTNDVDPSFQSTFTVFPAHTDFSVEVTCKGHSAYRSPDFYSTGVLGDPPAQLGEIRLEPMSGEHTPSLPNAPR